jgi:hypothetical protein
VRNSTAGQVANLAVSGVIAGNSDIAFASGTAFLGAFRHAITAARDWTFPDATGNVALNSVDNAFSTTQSVTGAVNASNTISVKNNGSTQSITFTGNPTGNRTITFPDADVTIGASNYIGSQTKAYLQAHTAYPVGTTAFCNDINGVSGGVTGVMCYLGAFGVGWLRYSLDNAI